MRPLALLALLLVFVGIARSEFPGWKITLANHHTLDSLKLTGLDGDSLRLVRRGVPFSLSIDDLSEMKAPRRNTFSTGILMGGLVGLAAFELIFEVDRAQEDDPTRSAMFIPLLSFDTYSHIACDAIGVVIGMAMGGLVGATITGQDVYDLRGLAHGDRLDLLESILEDEQSF